MKDINFRSDWRMKATEEDSEVFEITDFTTASEWERFIAQLEEVIHEWKLVSIPKLPPLKKGELANGKWLERIETVKFADFQFTLSRHYLHFEESENREVSPPEGENKSSNTGDSDTPCMNNDDDAGNSQVAESKIQEAKDDEEGTSEPHIWQDLLSVENDFPSRAHCLARWYGLRDFVVMAPASQSDSISTESRANILLSSISIALANTSCQIPMFVQLHNRWRRLYFGQSESPGFRTVFEMAHLKSIPPQYSHLAGLLDVFKAKLNCAISPLPPVTVSVRFTYVLQDWPHYSWPQQPPDLDTMMGATAEVGCTEFGDLPFGACEDPVSELHLSATWPSLSEEMIFDNDVYSDLDPLQAPNWTVRVRMLDEPQCLLGDYIKEFVQLCKRKESTGQLLGRLISEEQKQQEDITQALSKLTEPTVAYTLPSLGTVVTKATKKLQIREEEAPIPSDMLNEILLFIFPDAKSDSEDDGHRDCVRPSPAVTTDNTPATTPQTEEATPKMDDASQKAGQFKEMFRQFKSAPTDSIASRLAVCMCVVNHSYGGVRAVAHLWQEFVLEMRFRWENNVYIPDIEQEAPNMGCSLIYQKLQMLNSCIKHKITREELVGTDFVAMDTEESDGKPSLVAGLESCSSEEEFFECDGEKSDGDSKANQSSKPKGETEKRSSKSEKDSTNKSKVSGEGESSRSRSDESTSEGATGGDAAEKADLSEKSSPSSIRTQASRSSESEVNFKEAYTHQPEGRLRVYENMRLLHTDEHMHIPITQEPAPMTEDMLEEHAEVLAKLGTSPEGAHLRARMQSACLLSDMEAFKAANPGCVLGDFVRWYSPRDWIDEETGDEHGNVAKKGQLSQRMQIPGNMWVEVWQSAKPVPVRRQKRLFDETKEAEKVLHFLASLNPADVAVRLMPMVIHAAIAKLLSQEESSIPVIEKQISSIITKSTRVMRAPRADVRKFEELARQLMLTEILICRAQSLRTKFAEDKDRKDDGAPHELPPLRPEVHEFVASLLENVEVPVIGASRGPVGKVIHALFAAAQKTAYMLPDEESEDGEVSHNNSVAISDFPAPTGKEYILRSSCARPAPWSQVSPHRMYCVVIRNDFRLAGAFTTDTTFQ